MTVDRKRETLEKWNAHKAEMVKKWKHHDGYFRCTACGSVVNMVQRGEGYEPSVLLPVDVLMMSTEAFNTCLCYACYQKKQAAEYLEEQFLKPGGEAEPIVDYSLNPHGWGELQPDDVTRYTEH